MDARDLQNDGPRTSREKVGCLLLMLWALWSAIAGIWKTAEVIGQLIGL